MARRPGEDEAARRDRLEMRQHFEHCDRDRDHRIDYAEFVALLRDLEAGMSEDEIRVGFAEIDANRSGYIGFDEFRRWWLELGS